MSLAIKPKMGPDVSFDASQSKLPQEVLNKVGKISRVVTTFFVAFVLGRLSERLAFDTAYIFSRGIFKIAKTDKNPTFRGLIFNLSSLLVGYVGLLVVNNNILNSKVFNKSQLQEKAVIETLKNELKQTEVADPEKVLLLQEKQQQQVDMQRAWRLGKIAAIGFPILGIIKGLYDITDLVSVNNFLRSIKKT